MCICVFGDKCVYVCSEYKCEYECVWNINVFYMCVLGINVYMCVWNINVNMCVWNTNVNMCVWNKCICVFV